MRAKKAELRRAGRLKAREKARAAEHQAAVTPPREHAPGTQKTRQGVVVSDKADKTITVRIDLVAPAPQVSEDRRYAVDAART